MVILNKRNFYCGALLYDILDHGITAMLIESNDRRSMYQCTTDEGEFMLLMKYATFKTTSQKSYMSWQFSLSPNEIREISRTLSKSECSLQMVLICGDQGIKKCTYAVLNKYDIRKIYEHGIYRFTISIRPHESYFRINLGDGRKKALRIPARRKVGLCED